MNSLNYKSIDYDKYYAKQVGGNILDYHRGLQFQRGYGYFGRFFSRYGLPLLKLIGKEAYHTGSHVIQDIARGVAPKSALKSRIKERGLSILKNLIDPSTNQTGRGRKRKRMNSQYKSIKKKVIVSNGDKKIVKKKKLSNKGKKKPNNKSKTKKISKDKHQKIVRKPKLNFLD